MGDKLNKKFRLSILALAAAVIAYNVYDNNRITVKEQFVYIDNLPQEFDGFRILQLSDLHGKRFGKEQSYLISKVNSINYDILAFTGDMDAPSEGHSSSDSTGDLEPFIELLKGIENKEHMFYVNGNGDYAYSNIAGNIYASGDELEKNGCILLTEPYRLERSGEILWMSDYFSKSAIDVYKDKRNIFLGTEEEYSFHKEYLANLEKIFSEINGNGEIKIAITHAPFAEREFEQVKDGDILDFSLVLSGHYHGGQIRLPFYGALFVPGSRRHGGVWFPEQNRVSGLTYYDGTYQHVSAGLGSSHIPFRLFNTPEINLIILKTK